jgi:L-lactate permease
MDQKTIGFGPHRLKMLTPELLISRILSKVVKAWVQTLKKTKVSIQKLLVMLQMLQVFKLSKLLT